MNTSIDLMHKTACLIFSTILFFAFLSCAKDAEKSIEEQLIGSWSGDVVQESNGILEITLNITTLSLNAVSGSWTTKSKDLSSCDEEIFNCVEFECRGDLVYKETVGSIVKLVTELSSGPCWDSGEAQISNITDDSFSYTNTDPEGGSISGTFRRL